MNGSVLEEKSSFKMLGLTFSSKLDWGSHSISIAKTASIGVNLVDVLQKCLTWFHFPFFEEGLLVTLIDCMVFLSTFLDVTRISMSTLFFLAGLYSGILCL